MARLFIIDHSLKNEGGHHFDYTLLVANASVARGHETIVGTHKSFRRADLFPHTCRTKSVFRQTTYSSHAHFRKILDVTESCDNQSLTKVTSALPQHSLFSAAPVANRRARWKKRVSKLQREREATKFSRDLQTFFSEFRFQSSDHVFLPTVSEIDLRGISLLLQKHPELAQATWHVQFHFNLFVGRTPEYEFQHEFVLDARESLLDSIETLKKHRVLFYGSSQTLCNQFDALGIANIEPLPYPVNPELRASSRTGNRDKLQVTCAGGIRPEKGQRDFNELLQSLWEPFLKNDRINLVIQRRKRSNLRRQQLEVADSVSENSQEAIDAAINWADHPLPRNEYAGLIRNTDVGLLMYNSRAYYSRRAGILGEYLTAGIPVIVPAGTWMSDQIAEPNFQHVDQIVSEAHRAGKLRPENVAWQNNAAANLDQVVVGDRNELQPETIVATSGKASGIALEFDFLEPTTQGYFLKIEAVQHDQFGNVIANEKQIVGIRESGRPNSVFFRMNSKAHDIQLKLSNAYEDSLLLLSDIRVHSLTDVDASALRRPLGSVGLVAADLDEIPRLLEEVVENHAHYRSSAERFSGRWFDAHNPAETIQHLFRADSKSRAAA